MSNGVEQPSTREVPGRYRTEGIGRNLAARPRLRVKKGKDYLPAKDDPDVDRDAVGENFQDPRKRNVSDGMKTRDDQ